MTISIAIPGRKTAVNIHPYEAGFAGTIKLLLASLVDRLFVLKGESISK